MRKISVLIIAVLSAVVIPSVSCALPRLAVRNFDNKTDDPSVPAGAITDMMITELSKAGIFTLIEREKLNYVADEIRLGQSGLVDPSTAPEVGKIIGAQYSMTGAITMHFYHEKGGNELFKKLTGGIPQENTAYVMLDIRVIDNATGEDVYAHNELGKARRSAKVSATDGISRTYGGILAGATRNAVVKHIAEMKRYDWQ